MTKYIDRDDAAAIRRKLRRESRARADVAIAHAAPALRGAADEGELRTLLHEMVLGIIAELDELERQVLRDLDALCFDVPGGSEAGS